MQKFDEKTTQAMKHYVYALMDDNKIFYVGKGQGNRVFDHIQESVADDQACSAKLQLIRKIKKAGKSVRHIIIRHGLTEREALLLEATIIDLWEFEVKGLTNKASGHRTIEKGIMTADDIVRTVNAEPVQDFEEPSIVININRTYRRGSGPEGIYNATRGDWTLDRSKAERAKYAIAEYRGLIVEVFQIDQWERVDVLQGKRARIRFSGKVAADEVRRKYVNKSFSHLKKQGSVFPVRYFL